MATEKAQPEADAGRDRFLVVPAVDVLGEETVRLERGRFDRVSLRAGNPEDVVARLAAARPALLHLVDLEGAREGRIRPDLVARLVAAAGGVPVQVSGGVRSPDDAERLLGAGAARVVVGTAAFSGGNLLARLVAAFEERIAVALDVRSGIIAVSGWERSAGITVDEAIDRCLAAGVRRLLCTAIDRDGMLGGPDLELLGRVLERSRLPLLAAGGIRSERDLRQLAALGLEGAIVGRALLEGRIPLSALAGIEPAPQRGAPGPS